MLCRALLSTLVIGTLFASGAASLQAGASPEEWRAIKKEAMKLYMESTDQGRHQAIMKIGAADCREAVDLLVKLIKTRTPAEEALLAETKTIEKELKALYDRNKDLFNSRGNGVTRSMSSRRRTCRRSGSWFGN
ncbi:MAG: hypothetical protein ACYTHN_12470 [Planctomycetota bacterium]